MGFLLKMSILFLSFSDVLQKAMCICFTTIFLPSWHNLKSCERLMLQEDIELNFVPPHKHVTSYKM